MPQPHYETQQLISEVLGTLNAPGVTPATAKDWQCIAVWALVGYRVASGQTSPADGVVSMLMEAASVLDGCQPKH